MKLNLSQKILAGFISFTLILIFMAVLSFRNSKKAAESASWVSHTHEVLYELEQIMLASVNAETGERGYIITGNEIYLKPFIDAKSELGDHLEKIKQLVKDNPAQLANAQKIEAKSQAFLQRMEYCIDLRKTGSFENVKEAVNSGIGKVMLDEVRTMIERAKGIEFTLLAEREKANEQDNQSFNTVFMAMLVAIMVLLIVVYLIITTNIRALKKAEQETADKNWTLSSSAELIKDMQGNKDIKELSQAVIEHLGHYLDIQVGAMYVMSEYAPKLFVSGNYSLSGDNKKEFSEVGLGEGFVGQAAQENKMLELTEIPENYFNINTTFGEIRPRHIIALPFSFEGKITGVIELGSLYTISELKKQYLKLITGRIALAIVSAQSRKKTKELLEETQSQAEELEAQQEELRQTNEELSRKTELLQDSEAELKTQQEELEMTNAELESKAEILAGQKAILEQAKVELEEKAHEVERISRYKSEFLANMSHELRTPLNSILILSQLLSENKNNTLNEKEVGFSKNIFNSGNDLLQLINEILDLAKIESGKMELEIDEVPLNNIIQGMHNLFDELAKKKSVDFKIEMDARTKDLSIITDKQRVDQVLKNLLSNAFKFTPKDGRVTLAISRSGDGLLFAVKDTGIGIPASKQELIFEAFQQADGSTKRQYGGTGLGLSISRQLSAALKGNLSLLSEEGKGSTFTLYLPLKFDEALSFNTTQAAVPEKPGLAAGTVPEWQPEPELTPSNDDRHTITENDRVILIVEDDPSFAQILLDFVRDRHYKGIIAAQGNIGLNFAKYYKPDIILLDIELPVMNGVEILKKIKNDPEIRHIPVQIISGQDHKKQGVRLGAFDYLKKPVSSQDLQKSFEKIEKFIDKKLKKVLIVEDNKLQSEAIAELLKSDDVRCFTVYTGNDAYHELTRNDFDCVIVDLKLPDMSGFELLEKMKNHIDLGKIPAIVYTGKDLSKEEIRRLDKLADTVVLKTVNSHSRLLDETILFLHKVESHLPKEKQKIIRDLHQTDKALENKKVLLVDDDMRNIYSLSNALEEEGVRCLIAENGKAAIEELKKNPDVDLVLMDVMMPEMDGYEATAEIRKMPAFEKLPIIALTAKAMKGDREKCLEIGMSDYISKPVNLPQLLSLMRVWLYK